MTIGSTSSASAATEGTPAGAGSGAGDGGDAGYAGDPAFDAGGDAGGVGDAAGGGGDADAAAAGGVVQGGRFRFGQREWPSQERAEKEFLTTIGRLQAAQRRQAELEEMVDALKAGKAPAGADQGEPGAGEGEGAADEDTLLDIDSLDWQLISGAMRDRGPEVGMYLLAKALVDGINGGLKTRMGKALEPLESLRSHVQASSKTRELWRGAQEAVGENGSLLFPELSDPGEAQFVYDIWQQVTNGMPPEMANHPRMVRTAVLEYRFLRQQQGDAGQGGAGTDQGADGGDPGSDPNAVAAGVVGAMRSGAASAGVLPSGVRQTGPRNARQRPQTDEERIKASLLSNGQEAGTLGFRR